MSTTPDRAFAEVRFLTVAEVAAVMRVSKMTVYRLVHNGEMPAVRVGRSFRVPEQAVHDYLRDSFVETAVAGADTSAVGAGRQEGQRAAARGSPEASGRVVRPRQGHLMGSVVKKRRKRMAKKKHRKLLRRTRVQRRNKK